MRTEVIHIMPRTYYERTSITSLPSFVTSPMCKIPRIPSSVAFNDTLTGGGKEFSVTMVYARDDDTRKTKCTAFVKNRSYATMERMKLIQDYNCIDMGYVRNFNVVPRTMTMDPNYILREDR